jgi:hypothetical protein
VVRVKVIWLRKKLVEYEPEVQREGLVLYHGTNLPNLYRILKDEKLGSEVGRHGGVYERIGKFYMTKSPEWAARYARDASYDPQYYLPDDDIPDLKITEEIPPYYGKIPNYKEMLDPDVDMEVNEYISKLMKVFGVNELYDLYVAFASFMRYYNILDPNVYPKVIIKLTIRAPETLGNVYYDEDDFREWLKMQDTKPIVEVAKQDQEFRNWLSQISRNPNNLQNAEDIADAAMVDVEDTYLETFSYMEDEGVSDVDMLNAAFHQAAKQIYLALVRLAKRGNTAAHEILREAKSSVTSYALRERTPLEAIDEASATIYVEPSPVEINLKDANALTHVKNIMKEQILRWARMIA